MQQVNDQLDDNLYDAAVASPFTYTALKGSQTTINSVNFSGWKSLSGQDGVTNFDHHSLIANPDFVNAAAGNFALAAHSPALKAGTSKTNWYDPENFLGQMRSLPPNIGAY